MASSLNLSRVSSGIMLKQSTRIEPTFSRRLKFNFKRRQGITYQSVEKSSRNSDIVEMESVNIFTNEMPFERGLSFARRQ